MGVADGSDCQVTNVNCANEHLTKQRKTSGWSSLSIITLLFLLLAACDSQVDRASDRCPATAPPGKSDFFPMDVGQTRTYDYVYDETFPPTRWLTTGVLTWRVVSATECAYGTQTFSVEHTLSGEMRVIDGSSSDTTYSVSKSNTIEIAVHDTVIYPGPYFPDAIPRFYPLTGPDTLFISSGPARLIFGKRSESPSGAYLVRDFGMIRRHVFGHFGVGKDVNEDIYLIEPASHFDGREGFSGSTHLQHEPE